MRCRYQSHHITKFLWMTMNYVKAITYKLYEHTHIPHTKIKLFYFVCLFLQRLLFLILNWWRHNYNNAKYNDIWCTSTYTHYNKLNYLTCRQRYKIQIMYSQHAFNMLACSLHTFYIACRYNNDIHLTSEYHVRISCQLRTAWHEFYRILIKI